MRDGIKNLRQLFQKVGEPLSLASRYSVKVHLNQAYESARARNYIPYVTAVGLDARSTRGMNPSANHFKSISQVPLDSLGLERLLDLEVFQARRFVSVA